VTIANADMITRSPGSYLPYHFIAYASSGCNQCTTAGHSGTKHSVHSGCVTTVLDLLGQDKERQQDSAGLNTASGTSTITTLQVEPSHASCLVCKLTTSSVTQPLSWCHSHPDASLLRVP
jgi:hypothetical protein